MKEDDIRVIRATCFQVLHRDLKVGGNLRYSLVLFSRINKAFNAQISLASSIYIYWTKYQGYWEDRQAIRIVSGKVTFGVSTEFSGSREHEVASHTR